MKPVFFVSGLLFLMFGLCLDGMAQKKRVADPPISFDSLDDISVTAQFYRVDSDNTRPMIVLCHQAGWSRGEYQEIAPQLNSLGFNCLAIDQRSGGEVNGIKNMTAVSASQAGKSTTFVDAEQDIVAAIQFVRDNEFAQGKLILWGSSYSASLVLRIAGENPDLVDGVLAFAPGEYFQRFGKPNDWITDAAKNITVPVFVTSARKEEKNWHPIFEAISTESKVSYLPETAGNHGSRALWRQFDDSPGYREATWSFLSQYLDAEEDDGESAGDDRVPGIDRTQELPLQIAFGSCAHQDKPQPVLDTITGLGPDLFIYLGDNIYGDTKDMAVLQQKYDRLGSRKEFQNLRAHVPVLSVWDDHDYGWNDIGKEYEFKRESREIFLDFWQVPESSPRRDHEGIYGSHRMEADGIQVQIILLDTRTFRDKLKRNPDPLPAGSRLKNEYQPDDDADKTLLGEAQWNWLDQVLREPADFRVICSSIQFGHEYNGWESWNNLPREQEKMAQMIRDSGAGGVVFISGDVHWGEISKRVFDDLYPIYDVTASGLTEEWYNVEPNQFRVGNAFRDNHFGLIELDRHESRLQVQFKIIDVAGNTVVRHRFPLAEIQPAGD